MKRLIGILVSATALLVLATGIRAPGSTRAGRYAAAMYVGRAEFLFGHSCSR